MSPTLGSYSVEVSVDSVYKSLWECAVGQREGVDRRKLAGRVMVKIVPALAAPPTAVVP